MPAAALLGSLLFLIFAGFATVTGVLTERLADIPLEASVALTFPWPLLSFGAALAGTWLLRSRHLRMGYVLVALACAGPMASLIHLLIDLSNVTAFAPDF